MGTWGLSGGSSGGTNTKLVWDFDNGCTAVSASTAPGGRIDFYGNYPVKISGISFAASSNVDYIGGAGTYYSSGNFSFNVTAGNTGGQNRYLYVSIAGSGTINTYTGGGSYYQTAWSRGFTGTFNFDFVNTAPTLNSVSRNIQSVTVTASGAGGSDAPAPSSYTIQYNDNAGSGWVGDTASPATWSGLVRGRTYSFRSWANNSVGSSQIYTGGSVYIPNVPSTPAKPTVATNSSQSGAVDISWSAPSSDVAITGYKVFLSNGTLVANRTAAQLSFTHTNLTPRSSYSYYVIATNEMGDSSPSTTSNSVIASSVPSTPGVPTVFSKVGRTLTLSSTRGSSDYNNTISEYRIQLSTDNGATWKGWDNTAKTFTANNSYNVLDGSGNFTYTLLTPALTYKWRVFAVNSIGTGDIATMSSGTFVSAGGRRFRGTGEVNSGTWQPTENAKRYTGTQWVDLTVAKKYDPSYTDPVTGSHWKDLT